MWTDPAKVNIKQCFSAEECIILRYVYLSPHCHDASLTLKKTTPLTPCDPTQRLTDSPDAETHGIPKNLPGDDVRYKSVRLNESFSDKLRWRNTLTVRDDILNEASASGSSLLIVCCKVRARWWAGNVLTLHLTLLKLWHFIKIHLKLSGNAKLKRIRAKAVFRWSEGIGTLISDNISKKVPLSAGAAWFHVGLMLWGESVLRFLTPDTNLKSLNKL